MKYYKAKKDWHTPAGDVVEGELLTEQELSKFRLYVPPILFDKVEIASHATSYSFGVRRERPPGDQT